MYNGPNDIMDVFLGFSISWNEFSSCKSHKFWEPAVQNCREMTLCGLILASDGRTSPC